MSVMEMGRRKDWDIVEEIVRYIQDVAKAGLGTITQGDLCSKVGINSETAEKWLTLLQFIRTECPIFRYGKAGRYRIISTAIFPDSEVADIIKQLYLERGINASEFKAELLNAVTAGTRDFDQVETRIGNQIKDGLAFNPKFRDVFLQSKGTDESKEETEADIDAKAKQLLELKEDLQATFKSTAGLKHIEPKKSEHIQKAVLYCDLCGTEQSLPGHCGDIMTFEKTQFVCSFCSETTPVPRHCNEIMKIKLI
ncbi:MAG: hypothetical protein ACFFBD_16825 [Candidatus Hodarchaeota archaeon]